MSQPPPPLARLEYSMPPRGGRPGVLTAVGVISIIIACMSLLSSVSSIASSSLFLAMRKMPVPTFPFPATVPTPNANAGGNGTWVVGGNVTINGVGVQPSASDTEDAIREPQRSLVLNALVHVQPMDERRSRHLDLLLATAGRRIFPFAGNGASAELVRRNVSESGRLPSVGGGDGPEYFIIGAGRIEVYDDRAVFRPVGSGEALSVSATSPTGGAGAAAPAVPVPMTMFKIDPAALVLTIVEALLSMGVAILLLIGGIMVIRNSPRAKRMHWTYVWLKVPLALVAAVAMWWTYTGMMSGFAMMTTPGMAGVRPPMPSTRFMNAIMLVPTAMHAALAISYPVALIFVLRSRTVREYYGGLSDEVAGRAA